MSKLDSELDEILVGLIAKARKHENQSGPVFKQSMGKDFLETKQRLQALIQSEVRNAELNGRMSENVIGRSYISRTTIENRVKHIKSMERRYLDFQSKLEKGI